MAASRVFLPCFGVISLLFACSHAAEYQVGGSEDAWKVPSSERLSLSDWAKKQRFRIGDFLLFKYDQKVHSLLQLNQEDYQNCAISRPIEKFTEGYTRYELPRTGRFHFTGGTPEHCFNDQKLFVDVMAAEDLSEIEPVTETLAPAPEPSKADGLRVGFMGCVTLMMTVLFGV